ncbi:MAG TPA: glutaminyl-peptide cyclotransferase [Chitinophagaceae bacterium]|jgi:glutamine cyclotransferase|nr:glutaminyl-peptide cyclotransferase [Chitinophagaceae bacterium]
MKRIFVFAVLAGLVACKNKDQQVKPDPNAPKSMSYSIISTFPHDTSSYTQGLIIYKGEMYEGTGNYGFSKLMKMDRKAGKPILQTSLDKKYFGEGVTILNDTVYQLTWQQKVVLVYTLKDLKQVKEFPVNIDGWGLTNDGKYLIASNGGSDLFYYEPSTFKLVKQLTVTESSMASYNLNELEYVDGFIYANQYEYPYILKIDPATGMVVAKADVSNTWNRIKKMYPQINPNDLVPNGIAYDTASKKMYMTGKKWPELYEVQFSH